MMHAELTKPPTKRLIFDINPFQTTVILTESNRACEVFIENSSEKTMVGSIYKGIVQSILPGMSAAFVNIGIGKNAILHFRDIRVDRTSDGGGRYESLRRDEKPTDVLKVGAEIAVQIAKEPIGTKGPKVTMEMTLPGHTLVLLPAAGIVCMSKRFHSDAEKNRVKNILKAHIPSGYGVIARSESELLDEARIIADLEAILNRWAEIERNCRIARAPKLIWNEEDLISRAIRDFMRSDVSELVINSRNEYNRVCTILASSTPHLIERVRLIENEPDLLERFNLNKQLAEALSQRVWLKSGAYIVIDKTEALTSIDVNTGKNIGKSNVRTTILETNCEAAAEIAHQIRIRNTGGIIIIDFIDMEAQEDRDAVVDVLKHAMSRDPARPVVYGMTRLGLVEVARRRSGKSLAELYMQKCCSCDGSGLQLSAETAALKIRKRILSLFESGNTKLLICAYPTVLTELRSIIAKDIADGRLSRSIELSYHNDVFISPSEFDIKIHG